MSTKELSIIRPSALEHDRDGLLKGDDQGLDFLGSEFDGVSNGFLGV